MKHTILLWMTVCLLATSCSNILDKEPDFVSPDYYYNTESELLQALNGVYNRLIDTNGRMYSKGLFSFFVLSDESFIPIILTTLISVRVQWMPLIWMSDVLGSAV